MQDGKFYVRKNKKHNYNKLLQDCIKETCGFCIDNVKSKEHEPVMMLGKIQSGKTRSFIGLIALAFDNNFDMAIILTKNSTALVEQTRRRMKDEFDVEIKNNEIEVFDIMGLPNDGLTSYEINKKIILIAKKEHKNLDRITDFIAKYIEENNRNCLIIDDEADTTGIGFEKINNGYDEFDLRKVSSKVNDLRGSLENCVFVQVTATPYALYLQPEFDKEDIKPIKPQRTVLVPSGAGYIGGEYYFIESKTDDHQSRFIFEHVSDEENDLVSDQKRTKKSKIEDRRGFKIENIVTDMSRLKKFKEGLINFIVGGCVLRKKETNTHYAYLIHTATQKSSHLSLGKVAIEFFDQVKSKDVCKLDIIDGMIEKSYKNIKCSYESYEFEMPLFSEVKEMFYEAINKEFYSITIVNSDGEVKNILNEDTGELRLRTPFSIFVGGQVLDRGITIPNLVGFYYGRNPQKMQQDTVMQHSRMFGYRNHDLLSVTRFYTTKRIFENMTHITEIDLALREDIENKTFGEGIYFLQKHGCSRDDGSGIRIKDDIIPCSPSKIALSNTVYIKAGSRILPVGFLTVSKFNANKISNSINKKISLLQKEPVLQEPILQNLYKVSLPEIIDIIRDVYEIISADEGSPRFISCEHFISTLRYVSDNSNQILLYIRKNGTISKFKKNGMIYQDAPDTGYEIKNIRSHAMNIPALLLIHQDGTADGWNGVEFWWPIIIAPENVKKTIFVLPEAVGKIKRR